MTNSEGRTVYLETRIKWLTDQLAAMQDSVLALQSQMRLATASIYPGGGGGGTGDTFFVPSIPAITAGLAGTADVYHLVAGTYTLVTPGATIWNLYGSATTAGRLCTVGANLDGSYTILAQSCV